MAKKKVIETEVVESSVTQPVETESAPKKEAKEAENKTTQNIPESVLAILKMYSNYPEIYITKYGGVFVPPTQPQNYQNAILYKNPFYIP